MPQDSITITIDKPEAVAFLRAQYQRYGAASEAEFIDQCVDLAREDVEIEERWLKEVAMPRFKAWKASGQSGLSPEEVKQRMLRRREIR